MENKKIAVFGDSILKGVITVPNSGRIFDVVENDSLTQAQKVLGFELTNNSIYGNVITKAKGKFEKFIQKQKDANNLPDVVIIEFGNNDCDYDWNIVSDATNFSEIFPKTPLNDFLENLDSMVKLCKENNITPIIMTMPPLVGDRWFENVTKNLNKENIAKFLGENPGDKLSRNNEFYNLNIVEYAIKNDVKIADVRKLFLQQDDYRKLMCLDGIHPNQDGYDLLAKFWIEFFDK